MLRFLNYKLKEISFFFLNEIKFVFIIRFIASIDKSMNQILSSFFNLSLTLGVSSNMLSYVHLNKKNLGININKIGKIFKLFKYIQKYILSHNL